MTVTEYVQQLAVFAEQAAQAGKDGVMVNLPTTEIRVTKHDATAMRLIQWLDKTLPEDTTMADILDVLDAARWWYIYFGASHPKIKEILDEQPSDELHA